MKMSLFQYALRPIVLFLITACVAVALAGVYSITAPMIEQHKQQKIQAAMEEVLPGALGLKETEFSDSTGIVKKVYTCPTGCVMEVAPAGFGGSITMMVGILPDGSISGISVVSHTETAGLGSVVAADNAAGEAFRGQFVGLSGSLAVDKDGGQIDSVTSATITSRAVTQGVNAALECWENLE